MKGLKYITIMTILAVLLLAAVTPQQASAGAPIHYKVPLDDSGTYPALSENNPCEFDIDYSLEGTLIFHEWYDENGQLLVGNYNWAGVKNTLSANGKTLFQQDSGLNRVITLSATQYLAYIQGHSWSIAIPGEGIVYGSIGRWELLVTHDGDGNILEVEVLSQHGINLEDPTPICDYLGP